MLNRGAGSRAAFAFAAGLLSVLALPPFDFWPILFLTFPPLVWLIDSTARSRANGLVPAALIGWCFGFGYFLGGLYWVGYAFLVDAKTFGWLLPIAVTALPAGLALFFAFGFALARLLWLPGRAARILSLALALTVSEWLRGHVLTGFPWNTLGYALTGSLSLAQNAALVGLWGLTFIAVMVFASPAVLADQTKSRRKWLPLAGSLMLLAVMAAYGALRLANTPTQFVDGVALRIMQPNLPQDEKFNSAARDSVMERYLGLSARTSKRHPDGLRDVTHLIWPESAFPFLVARDAKALNQIADLLPETSVLITGAARMEQTAGEPPRIYNSIHVIDANGEIRATYDKLHLVPFGEYLPFQAVLERIGLQQLTKVIGGFSTGAARANIEIPGAPSMLPLICYEIIFPRQLMTEGERPGWLLNLTNDAWFGISSGPYQHFRQAQMRSIEEGLPLVRAANNGISAVVDPLGRIVASLPLGAEGILDAPLPQPIPEPLHARTGNVPLGTLFVALLAFIWWQPRHASFTQLPRQNMIN